MGTNTDHASQVDDVQEYKVKHLISGLFVAWFVFLKVAGTRFL